MSEYTVCRGAAASFSVIAVVVHAQVLRPKGEAGARIVNGTSPIAAAADAIRARPRLRQTKGYRWE
jgi:hypothetical protein